MRVKHKCDFNIIGKRISSARKEKGMTQEYLAAQIGIGEKHLSEIERGMSGFAVGTLIEIARILEISTDYLLIGIEPQHSLISDSFKNLDTRERYYLEQIINNFIRCCRDKKQPIQF